MMSLGSAAPRRRRALLAVAVVLLVCGAWTTLRRPSHDRDWVTEQQLLPVVSIGTHDVTVDGVRNFTYDSAGTAIPSYSTRRYDLDAIRTVDFVLSPFEDDWRGPAHAFVTFGFADSQYVAVSVEARREKGEDYSIVKGLLRSYELIYVIGDERDLIGNRVARNDDVYVYPMRASADQVRTLFIRMMSAAADVHDRPRFYNTLTNNCTTNIVEHVNSLGAVKIPYGREVLMPGYADELAVKLGLMQDTTATIEEVRARYLVNDRATSFAGAADFSIRIRTAQ
jgi:hypothetical protein